MKCKNTIAMVLAGAMLLPTNAFAADLSQYKDFPSDWSAKSLEQAIDDGLLNGSNGMIDAKGLLTRAQMAAIVSRAFGASKTASLDDYRDVLPSAWYYSDMGKAVKMGAFQGANGLLNPDAPITREEAFTVLARAFALEGGGSATLKDFVDGGTVSSWASESVAALVSGGYVNGANGMLNLKNNITRAEFAKVITGMAASYVGAESVSGKTVNGNVIVRESGASLSGMTINGDLIIADSADKASLDGVTVTGRIVIRGGADAVSIKDSKAGKGVLVSSPNGAAAISVSGGSVGTVTAKSDLSLSGSVSNVAVTDKATLTVEKNASVGTVTVSAAGSKVTGDGKVTNVQANANNVTVTSKGAKVTAGSGVSGVKAGDKTVEAGKTETVGTTTSGDGSSSGGGSSSSRSDYSYVLMNIPYDEFYKAELNENAAAVDAVSSATKNKTRIGTLAGGSYHVNPDGLDITGVTYPVRVKTSDLSGLKKVTDSDSVSITVKKSGKDETSTYTGREALFESASYSYYALSSTPSYYKEATLTNGKWSFGKATGAASEDTATIAKFKTPGHHADYEIKVESDKIEKGQKVYAVVLTDTDGNSYGLRHVVEIWRATELGFKADSPIVGKTIKTITYYTDNGVIKLNLAQEQYIPQQAATATVTEADFAAGETTVTLSNDLPSDFTAAYSFTVNGEASNFFTYADGKITWDESASDIPSGTYQLVIHDDSGKYADITAQIKLNVYAYASVPYDEYWQSEGVYLSGNNWTASSDVADRTTTNKDGSVTEEHDKGAFDAVSRATQNHGLHRGSFQQDVVIHTADRDYHPVSWPDEGKGNTFIDADGNTYNKTEIGITSYNITGIKYVPVKVSASDFADFCTKYTVTRNGETMQGGYSENNLSAYTDLVAAVDANTNGLKAVTKGKNGYTFGKRQTGTGSGIQGQSQKTADAGIAAAAKDYSGNFGEMLRVDLDNTQDSTKYYGDLGSHMQTVVWKYYGDGDTVLATYGTKFAADDWMHKSMGIQLGLTDSLRFKLPEGTDGTGKWTITIYALGYSDTTYEVDVTADNLPKAVEPMTAEQKTQLENLRDQAKTLLDAAKDPNNLTSAETTLKSHYDEIVALLADKDATKAAADELIKEVPDYIKAVQDERANKPVTNKTAEGEATVTSVDNMPVDGSYQAKVTVTFDSDGKVVSVVDNGTTPDPNSYYWNIALGHFDRFVGVTKDTVDSVDATSGATVSMNAVKKAVKNALQSESEQSPSAPALKAADARTQLLYAATSPAVLTVSAGDGCIVRYTTDGSTPSVDGNTAETLEGTTLTIQPTSNADNTVTVKAIAVKDGKASDVTEKTVQFVAIPDLTFGTRTYIGTVTDGGVSGGPYQISVRVTTTNGRITRVQDNGTEDSIDNNSDYAYWIGHGAMKDDGMPAKLRGKSLSDVLNMQTVPDDDDHNADAVSGATVWSDAIRHAAIAALRSAPVSESASTVLAPTLTEQTCVPNASYKYIDVAMNADDDTTIRYTLDGTDPSATSTKAEKIGWSGDVGVELTPDLTNHPDGQVIEVRAAAFAKDGTRSDVVRQFYVFANPLSNAAYTAQYSGISATVDGITATAVTQSPNYDDNYYITSLTLDKEHSEKYADFLPELFSRIYFAQTTEGVRPVTGHEAESKAVLAAVKAALNQALTASKPTLSVSPEKTSYDNGDKVTVTLGCPTVGAEIYYTVDNSNTLTGSTLSDPTKTGTKYTGPFEVSIDNIAGGKLYICTAANKDGSWSATARKDLTFLKGVKENAFVVNGQNYQSWSGAIDAVNAANGGTIELNNDVELSSASIMPSVPCTIRSAGETKYKLSGSPLTLNGDLTLENITYSVSEMYANGHALTIADNVETPWRWSARQLYAGSTSDSTATDTQRISVQAGNFAVIASGGGSTTHKANMDVAVGGSAEVELAGAYMGATLEGNVTFHVVGGVKLNQFYGEQNGGKVTGDLTLIISGAPTMSTGPYSTYKASVNKDLFGTLDLSEADSDFVTNNKDKFTGFAEVKTASA